MSGRATVAERLRTQAGWCERLGSSLYGLLLTEAAADVEARGPVWQALRGHAGDPVGSMLALRFMGAVHRLVLQGRAPALADFYPTSGGAGPPEGAWPNFRALVEERGHEIRDLLSRPGQTNEAGRPRSSAASS